MPGVAIDARDGFAPEPRGWGRYVRELVAALRAGPAASDLDLDVIVADPPGPEAMWEQVGLPLRLWRTRAAVVHAPNCFLPLVRPCPGVVTVHDLAFEAHPEDFAPRTAWKFRTLTPRAVRSAERVICVSRFTADDVVARYGADEERLRVIPNGPSLATSTVDPPPGPYLLAIGDLRAKKNLGRLVEAFGRLREEGLPHRLLLAGTDAGQGASLAAPGVELLGYVLDERLDALLRGADALVHPSLYEGFGLVLVEAMARGCPVAAARATALPETAGDAAWYFDPLDVGDMARAIREVVADRELRERLVAAGRARAAELSWERSAALTADVYRELL